MVNFFFISPTPDPYFQTIQKAWKAYTYCKILIARLYTFFLFNLKAQCKGVTNFRKFCSLLVWLSVVLFISFKNYVNSIIEFYITVLPGCVNFKIREQKYFMHLQLRVPCINPTNFNFIILNISRRKHLKTALQACKRLCCWQIIMEKALSRNNIISGSVSRGWLFFLILNFLSAANKGWRIRIFSCLKMEIDFSSDFQNYFPRWKLLKIRQVGS